MSKTVEVEASEEDKDTRMPNGGDGDIDKEN